MRSRLFRISRLLWVSRFRVVMVRVMFGVVLVVGSGIRIEV